MVTIQPEENENTFYQEGKNEEKLRDGMKIIGVGRAAEPCGPSFHKARPVFKEYFSIRTLIFPCFASKAQIIILTTLWKGSL